MVTVDKRCTHHTCQDKDIYRMVGRCVNCGQTDLLILNTSGHEATKADCPRCGCDRSVTQDRLATDDEIPVA
jgi:hypothetical protein